MKYNKLGRSDLHVSAVSFGAMSLERHQDDNDRLISKAIDSGINFFDTADIYEHGDNERRLGKVLKGKRHKVVLATKAGNQWKPDGSGLDWNPTKEHILAAADESLKRLQTDYIDLFQLHGGTIEDPIDETVEAFELLQQQGKIRYYGISSIRPNVIREYANRSAISSVMMQYSLLDRRPEETCLDLLADRSIGVLARGALAQGLLAGKPAKPVLGHSEKEVKRITGAVKELTAGMDEGIGPAQVALLFVLRHPAIASVVAGIRTNGQLDELLSINQVRSLTDDEYHFLADEASLLTYEQHR
ncbi:aldo/keto reductase [Hufsiella ginkgonis]|uniref:Aldo/keto reductase n=1 Tax=Hufsiella ginkgonis TaxID=2695274 RepID=A0A7K1XWB9_9SPHI|nr:aldo/keto reductase [Hufsiella ginkgonis]MXV15293.1 aldo/keto reductase [Hufsiella ginkgonis]